MKELSDDGVQEALGVAVNIALISRELKLNMQELILSNYDLFLNKNFSVFTHIGILVIMAGVFKYYPYSSNENEK